VVSLVSAKLGRRFGQLTRENDCNVSLGFSSTLVDCAFFFQINGPVLLFSFGVLDLELEDSLYLNDEKLASTNNGTPRSGAYLVDLRLLLCL
jgi:hypothetical protein